LCTNPCKTCSISGTTCTSCVTGSYLHNNSCLSSCPSTYWENTSTNTCDSCNDPCLTCDTNANDCLSCVDNTFYLSTNNSCGTTCPDGKWENSTGWICTACTSPC